ncbi:hypothetical protein ABZW32_08460 [Streptomyces sp. NPDC004667]|uniref:hypothetical protein n=1 Tax=Streptomyces sp. NPDC004667 TaxID=3154285 RepID=UPI0033A835D3
MTDERNRRSRRTAATLTGGSVALAVLAGAGFWASGELEAADRSAPTRYWVPEEPRPAQSPKAVPTVPPNALAAKLLPTGYELTPGPDIGPEGNNFSVTGDRAVQMFKESLPGLSGEARGSLDKELGAFRIKGFAGRSYLLAQSAAQGGVAEIRLTQADPQALAVFADLAEKLMAVGGRDRPGPKVDGYPDARCAAADVGPEERKEKDRIPTVECLAVEGDLLVGFRAYGPRSRFSDVEATDLFKKQLGRVKSPGESV